MTSRQRRAVLTLVCVVAACDSPAAPVVDEEPVVAARPASPTLGHLAFIAECASCHASRDGFDLAFFSFPDSTIIRRALGHGAGWAGRRPERSDAGGIRRRRAAPDATGGQLDGGLDGGPDDGVDDRVEDAHDDHLRRERGSGYDGRRTDVVADDNP